jgi:hypothetical protein
MKYTLEEKVKFTEHVVNILNKYWITYKGDLDNRKDLWKDTLHSFHNEDWEILMEVMEVIRIEDASTYLPKSHDTFNRVREILMRDGHSANPKAMDARKHKYTAFLALMHVKDCWNNFTGYEAPTKFAPDPEPETPFENLFEREDQ